MHEIKIVYHVATDTLPRVRIQVYTRSPRLFPNWTRVRTMSSVKSPSWVFVYRRSG